MHAALLESNIKLTPQQYGQCVGILVRLWVGTAFKSHATSFNIFDEKEATTEETKAQEQMGSNASPSTINGPTMVRKLLAFALLSEQIFSGNRRAELDQIDPKIVTGFLKLCKKLRTETNGKLLAMILQRMQWVYDTFGSCTMELVKWHCRQDNNFKSLCMLRGQWMLVFAALRLLKKKVVLSQFRLRESLTLETVHELVSKVCKSDPDVAKTIDVEGVRKSMRAQVYSFLKKPSVQKEEERKDTILCVEKFREIVMVKGSITTACQFTEICSQGFLVEDWVSGRTKMSERVRARIYSAHTRLQTEAAAAAAVEQARKVEIAAVAQARKVEVAAAVAYGLDVSAVVEAAASFLWRVPYDHISGKEWNDKWYTVFDDLNSYKETHLERFQDMTEQDISEEINLKFKNYIRQALRYLYMKAKRRREKEEKKRKRKREE